MLRKTLIALLLCCAAFTGAQAASLEGVIGEGIAVNADRKEGIVSIRASKLTNDNGTRIQGAFRFVTTNRETRTIVTIEALVGRLAVDGNTAAFGGRGVMVVRRGNDVRRIEGTIEGHCADNHNPRQNDDRRDGIGFTFRPTNTALEAFQFRGLLRRGDIHVFSRTDAP